MKWSSHNINVVEWAKIPKLSALDDSQTSRIILYDVLVDAILCYIKLSSRAGINFEITNEKILLFLSMLLLTGYHKFPDHKMYWEATPDTSVLARCDLMSRNTFECILQNLNLCGNEQLDKYDKFSKLLPVINKSDRRSLKFSSNRYNKSIV